MINKKIALAALVGLTSLTMLGVATINLDAPSELLKSIDQNESFTFDSNIGGSYFNNGQTAVVPRTSDPNDDINGRVEGAGSFGGGRFCVTTNNPIDTRLRIAIGVNNLQSFAFTFHINFSDPAVADDINYTAVAKFCGLKFDFGKMNYDWACPVLFSRDYEQSSLEKNHQYTISWTKTTEAQIVRHIMFEITLHSWRGTQLYCPLFMDYFTLTWAC